MELTIIGIDTESWGEKFEREEAQRVREAAREGTSRIEVIEEWREEEQPQ